MAGSGSPLSTAIIGTANLSASLAFYREVIGMEVVADTNWAGNAFEHHWNLPSGCSAHAVVLRAGPYDVGQVMLLEFSPNSGQRIYEPGVRSHYGLFNLNLYVDDVHSVVASLKKQGFDFWAEPVEPTISDRKEGQTLEALFDDPSGVAINLIQLLGGDETTFIGRMRLEVEKTTKTSKGFTPVATSAHIVRDEFGVPFYRDVLGMTVAMDMNISNPHANLMLGRPENGTTRSVFLEGSHLFGKIVVSQPLDYELPISHVAAAAPNTGYLAQSFSVPDLEDAAKQARKLGGSIYSSSIDVNIPGSGDRRALLLKSPGSGSLIQLVANA